MCFAGSVEVDGKVLEAHIVLLRGLI
jgi:hypothetical protein